MAIGSVSGARERVGFGAVSPNQRGQGDQAQPRVLGRDGAALSVVAAEEPSAPSLRESLLEERIERLCQRGCRAVYRALDVLRQGVAIEETRGLNDMEIDALVKELESVMAVYDQPCDL